MARIEVIDPPYSDDFYKAKVMQAYTVLKRNNNLKTFLTVIAALCRQAYLKGRHDAKTDKA